MAAEEQESFGRTILRGMAWGFGFAVVSVPVTMVIRHVLHDDEENPYRFLTEGEKDDLERARLRRKGYTEEEIYEEYPED